MISNQLSDAPLAQTATQGTVKVTVNYEPKAVEEGASPMRRRSSLMGVGGLERRNSLGRKRRESKGSSAAILMDAALVQARRMSGSEPEASQGAEPNRRMSNTNCTGSSAEPAKTKEREIAELNATDFFGEVAVRLSCTLSHLRNCARRRPVPLHQFRMPPRSQAEYRCRRRYFRRPGSKIRARPDLRRLLPSQDRACAQT